MSISQIAISIAIGLLVLIPIPQFFKWMRSEFGNPPIDPPPTGSVFFDGTLPLVGWTILFQFLKGYAALYVLHTYLDMPLLAASAVCLMVFIQYWISGYGLSRRPYSWFLLWGIASAINPALFLVFPLLLIGITILLNSFDLALVLVTGGVALWMVFNQEPFWIVLGGLGIFVMTALAYLTPILNYFEGKGGLVDQFDNRDG